MDRKNIEKALKEGKMVIIRSRRSPAEVRASADKVFVVERG